jgi:glutathione peroxidase
MKKHYLSILGFCMLLSTCASAEGANMPNVDDFFNLSAVASNGNTINFEDYRGKVVLVVNTASNCGFTPQYTGLEDLYKQYQAQGLVVLGFPCNQFANQEAGTDVQIAEFCSVNYGVTFPLFSKIEVNGAQTHPVFAWLKNKAPGMLGNDIPWNFTKFLVDREGKTVQRFAPGTLPSQMVKEIEKLL